MSINISMSTPRAEALQQAIQDELMNRGYSSEPDPVMAEYITIMLINNKTPAQITTELEDLIGGDFNPVFTDWLFSKAAEIAADAEPASTEPSAAAASQEPQTPSDATSQTASDSRPTTSATSGTQQQGPRSGLYQQAISQAIPSSTTAQKRSASARSPSPHPPNKSRRMDLPTGPRAMQREGGPGRPSGSRLLDRISDAPHRPNQRNNFQARDDIQARIDNITANAGPDPSMMMQPGFPGMGGMDMNAMANMNMMGPNMAPGMDLQNMMLTHMALVAQMANQLGVLNGAGQFNPPFAMPPGPMGLEGVPQPNPANGNIAPVQQPPNATRGRGVGRGGRPTRGRGGSAAAGAGPSGSIVPTPDNAPVPTPPTTVMSPTPVVAQPGSSSAIAAGSQPIPYAVPERPQSPTLCKFGLKCTNAHCRYSHPSPVATVESGVVLSNEACENGKECKDKDCVKAHVSPAALNPTEHKPPHHAYSHPAQATHSPIPCRFGAACTRPGCTFNHPPRAAYNPTPCRFGAACTKSTCQFQHPEGRVLPTAFHRGLSTSGGLVTVSTPETGTMGGPSPHKSVTFNNAAASTKEKLEKQMKELQEKKSEAEKAVKEAQSKAAANNGKKDESKSVPIAA